MTRQILDRQREACGIIAERTETRVARIAEVFQRLALGAGL